MENVIVIKDIQEKTVSSVLMDFTNPLKTRVNCFAHSVTLLAMKAVLGPELRTALNARKVGS